MQSIAINWKVLLTLNQFSTLLLKLFKSETTSLNSLEAHLMRLYALQYGLLLPFGVPLLYDFLLYLYAQNLKTHMIRLHFWANQLIKQTNRKISISLTFFIINYRAYKINNTFSNKQANEQPKGSIMINIKIFFIHILIINYQ